jgi:hypothetical protein
LGEGYAVVSARGSYDPRAFYILSASLAEKADPSPSLRSGSG